MREDRRFVSHFFFVPLAAQSDWWMGWDESLTFLYW